MIEGSEETKRIACLDGWRGCAILCVLFGHFVPGSFSMGAFGVELFFVLSGRLMAEILFVKRVPLPTFFVRRFSRIYPALLVLVLTLAAATIAGRISGLIEGGVDSASVVTALTFTINYAAALHWVDNELLLHVWSLSIEEHCYAVLALIAFVFARSERAAMPICFGLAGLAMVNGIRLFAEGAGGVHEIYWRTDVRLAPVFLSAALFLLMRRFAELPSWLAAVCATLSLPIYLLAEPLPVKYILPTMLLAVAVNSLHFSAEWLKHALASRWLVAIGMISYSLYLWQQPLYVKTGGAWWALPPALILAALSYRHVETPARRLINQRWNARS
jgi:peptidoglycan/LPS O-acetylase OafA/YrhL